MSDTFAPMVPGAPVETGYVSVPTRYLGPDTIAVLGRTLVVAAHADDDIVACGGLIALLQDSGLPVGIVILVEGRRRERESEGRRRRAIRENGVLRALRSLGITTSQVVFFRCPEGRIPGSRDAEFAPLVERLRSVIDRAQPATIVFPFRADADADHRATFAVVRAAVKGRHLRQLEFPVQLGVEAIDALVAHDFTMWQLDAGSAYERKLQALAGHAGPQAAAPESAVAAGDGLDGELRASFNGRSETFFEFDSEATVITGGPVLRGESHERRGEHETLRQSDTMTAEELF